MLIHNIIYSTLDLQQWFNEPGEVGQDDTDEQSNVNLVSQAPQLSANIPITSQIEIWWKTGQAESNI